MIAVEAQLAVLRLNKHTHTERSREREHGTSNDNREAKSQNIRNWYRSFLFCCATGMFRRTSAIRAGSTSASTIVLSCSLVATTFPHGSTIELCPHAWYLDVGLRAGDAVTT